MSSEGSPRPIRPLTGAEFRRACATFATGVTVAAVRDGQGTPHGLTVNSFSSVSLEPPLILICLGHAVTSIEVFRAASHFGLSVLRDDQRSLSERFARKDEDRFDGLEWRCGPGGAPLLNDALAQIECVVTQRVTAGDHDILIGEMAHAEVREGEPLVYFGSKYRRLNPGP